MFLSCFYLNFITLRTDLTLKILNRNFHSLPRWNNRDLDFLCCLKQFLKWAKCMKPQYWRHWPSSDEGQWTQRRKMNEVSTMTAQPTALREFPGCSTGRGNQAELRRCKWESRKTRQLEFAGQSPERSPEICRRYPSSTQQRMDIVKMWFLSNLVCRSNTVPIPAGFFFFS